MAVIGYKCCTSFTHLILNKINNKCHDMALTISVWKSGPVWFLGPPGPGPKQTSLPVIKNQTKLV